MNHNILSICTGAVLLVLLILLTDPFMLWMPKGAQMAVLLCAVFTVFVWAGVVLREMPRDEREKTHAMFAGRVAYLFGVASLTTALVVQGLSHSLDPWIPMPLGVMVLSKIGTRLYLDYYR